VLLPAQHLRCILRGFEHSFTCRSRANACKYIKGAILCWNAVRELMLHTRMLCSDGTVTCPAYAAPCPDSAPAFARGAAAGSMPGACDSLLQGQPAGTATAQAASVRYNDNEGPPCTPARPAQRMASTFVQMASLLGPGGCRWLSLGRSMGSSICNSWVLGKRWYPS